MSSILQFCSTNTTCTVVNALVIFFLLRGYQKSGYGCFAVFMEHFSCWRLPFTELKNKIRREMKKGGKTATLLSLTPVPPSFSHVAELKRKEQEIEMAGKMGRKEIWCNQRCRIGSNRCADIQTLKITALLYGVNKNYCLEKQKLVMGLGRRVIK